MAKTKDFSGKDIDLAIKNACTKLTLSKNELKYDVISEGASGIFGIVGRKDAKIRVVLPDMDKDAQARADLEGIRSIVDEAFGEETRLEPIRKVEKTRPEPTRKKESNSFEKPELVDVSEEAVNVSEKAVDVSEEAVDVSEEAIALGNEALQKMVDLITDDAKVSARTESDRLTLSIEGGNSGILIGRKGQTLDAMQFLTDKIINRKSEARVRVKVDIEGYMETRKSNLKHLAHKMADKAKKTGRPATISQMSAQDRRIVHLALKDDNQVRTQSMGDGYYRRLVIFPKKKNAFKGKRQLKK
ncbi:MAG: Jag N-terminal domain-containing protein [Deltaproteobacteria bacterium]|uniref:RNA-binding cell elongation regulator Jag/EloR n=1 Tax=Desulfobacula sp. TaxID=2593537 RepID=UPI0019B2C193|nr:Jag N-terminal domain-containing protein [Candidatus Desulfobacula maris]MBL6992896.1 Jag N-terminal domain-containing protein [Desulfobacula sp.]